MFSWMWPCLTEFLGTYWHNRSIWWFSGNESHAGKSSTPKKNKWKDRPGKIQKEFLWISTTAVHALRTQKQFFTLDHLRTRTCSSIVDPTFCSSIFIIGKMLVPLGGYPSSCSQNITLYCPIELLYSITHLLVVYVGKNISGTLPREGHNFSLWL